MNFTPIAYTSSPYKQKFAIPRQPNLVQEALGEIRFTREFSDANALRGLEQFTHLWLVWVFHETAGQGWNATVAPPRLGGTERVGVFATRSMYRPNPIGLSVVEFAGVEQRGSDLVLKVRGLDLLDGTPILDIKPYLPYADAVPDATGGFAAAAPQQQLEVHFSASAREQLAALQPKYPELAAFITSVLKQDPRPAQHKRKETGKVFAMLLHDLNVRWQMHEADCEVPGGEVLGGEVLGCEVLSIEITGSTQFPSKPGTR